MFYTYRIFNEYGDTLYIGKGSGYRLKNQIKRFGFFGEVLKTFDSEAKCLRDEIRLIAKHKPPLNKTRGGEAGGKERLDIFYELSRLIRIGERNPDLKGGMWTIIASHIRRIGYPTCKRELEKFNVFLELEAPRC
jgi:hypothetical protein